MTLFLLRSTERGKEPHAAKLKLRHDIADRLLAAVPDARLSFDVGRIYVEVDRDITEELGRLHGVSSFSPCTACDLDDLDRRVLEVAEEHLAPGDSFRVKVRRAGTHTFTSSAKAAELGAKILERVPGVRVDLRGATGGSSRATGEPAGGARHLDLVIEIRDRACFVCTAVIPGLDARRAEEEAAGEAEGTPEPPPAGEPRFLVDAMLGTLASRLRAFGYDTEWRRDTADSLLLREAAAEQRVVLTQDRELAEIGGRSAFFVHGKTVDEQLAGVMRRFALAPSSDRLFTRCSLCNAPLEPIAKESARDRVPARVLEQYDAFWACRACDKIYWKGSHHEEMLTFLRAARERR